MVKRVSMAAAPREVLGKKVKRLRAEGLLPGNVYGRGIESIPVQLDGRDFLRTVRAEGVRSMFELSIEGEGDPRLVLIRGLDREGGMGKPMHVDFFQVDVERPLVTAVPIRLTGKSTAVTDLGGTLILGIESLSVRCLPLDIPDTIEVSLESIDSFDVSITVASLNLPDSVEVLVEDRVNIATVNAPRLAVAGDDDYEGDEDEEAEEGEAADGDAESAE